MTGGENGAAVLIGQDGGLEGVDLPGDADDLLLVHADDGTEDGQAAGGVGHRHGLHGLAGHLAQGLTGDQSVGTHTEGHLLGDAHHEPAHEQGEQGLGAGAAELLLDLGEGDHMDGHPAAPGGDEPGQLQDLVLGLGGGVGIAEEVDHLQGQAPLGHHPGGHGGVDAAGQQGDRSAPHAHRQTACAGGGVGVDIGRKVTDLHVDHHVGVVHIGPQMLEGLVQLTAHKLGQLDGGHGEGLVGPLGLHLEGLGLHEVVVQVGLGGLQDGLGGLVAGLGPGQAHHAEEVLQGLKGAVHVAVQALGLHVSNGLAGVDAELAVLLQTAAGVGHEAVLEVVAVQALQDHLAHFHQDDLVTHGRGVVLHMCHKEEFLSLLK